MATLVKPSVKYKASFLRALREYHREGRYRTWKYERLAGNFLQFTERLKAQAAGKHLPKGWVPVSYYWLVEKNQFIGIITVRHKLNERLRNFGGHIGYSVRPSKRKLGHGKKMLHLALACARRLGLKKVLITCDENNAGSRKIIEANGGKFCNKIRQPQTKKLLLRFWIKL